MDSGLKGDVVALRGKTESADRRAQERLAPLPAHYQGLWEVRDGCF